MYNSKNSKIMKKNVNKNEILASAKSEIAATAANNATSNFIMNEVAAPAQNKVAEVTSAIAAIKTAVAAVKSEVLSPRAICRALRDLMVTNTEVAAFAVKLGLTPTANKAKIDAAAKNLLQLLPYYIITKIPKTDGSGVDEIINAVTMQQTSVDGVYVARPCKDIFKLLESAWLNDDAMLHMEVKANHFYKFDGDGNCTQTEKVQISKNTDKKAARAKRLKDALNENNIEDVFAAMIAKFGNDKVLEVFGNMK